jgi:hypothetical protein
MIVKIHQCCSFVLLASKEKGIIGVAPEALMALHKLCTVAYIVSYETKMNNIANIFNVEFS